jgi:LysM repeat protein
MMRLRDLGNALVVALISAGLVVGALSVSLVEFVPQATATVTNVIPPSPLPLTATLTSTPTLTPTMAVESPTPSATSTSTNTALPPPMCLPPAGWGQIVVRAGDTLDSIAIRYRTSKDALRAANCLLTDNLMAGTVLYAPIVPTITPATCGQGAAGWVKNYTVRPGDTVYSIAVNHYTTAGLLKSVNCRGSDLIYPGEVLWVPTVSTRTPSPTAIPGIIIPGNTATPYPTDPLTQTALPFTLTPIPSATPVPPSPTTLPFTLSPIPSPTAFQATQ